MQNVCRQTAYGNDVTFDVAPDPHTIDKAAVPEFPLDERSDPEASQSVNRDLGWLQNVYRMVDPRFNRITRDGLERALVGLDVAQLGLVRDINSVILKDQLEIIGGYPEAYEQISLYTDYIFVDNFLTQLMGEAGANAGEVAPEKTHLSSPYRAHAELNRGFTWDQGRQTIGEAYRTNRKRGFKHAVSQLWHRSSIRRSLMVLF